MINTDFNNKFPIISELTSAFDFIKTTPEEISQMGSAPGFAHMLQFEMFGHKFDLLQTLSVNTSMTTFIRGFIGMIFFVLTIWTFIHELPEIVKG